MQILAVSFTEIWCLLSVQRQNNDDYSAPVMIKVDNHIRKLKKYLQLSLRPTGLVLLLHVRRIGEGEGIKRLTRRHASCHCTCPAPSQATLRWGYLVAWVIACEVGEDASCTGQHVDIVRAQLGDQNLQQTVQSFLHTARPTAEQRQSKTENRRCLWRVRTTKYEF